MLVNAPSDEATYIHAKRRDSLISSKIYRRRPKMRGASCKARRPRYAQALRLFSFRLSAGECQALKKVLFFQPLSVKPRKALATEL